MDNKLPIEAAEKCEPACFVGSWWNGDKGFELYGFTENRPEPGTPLYTHPQPAIPDGWQAVVSEFIAAWDGSADPKAVGSTCRFIRAESALRDLIAPKQEETK